MIPSWRTACAVLVAWSGVIAGAVFVSWRSMQAVARSRR